MRKYIFIKERYKNISRKTNVFPLNQVNKEYMN